MSKKKAKTRLLESFGKAKDDYFNFNVISRYHLKKVNASAMQVISDKTCADLDFEELFMFVDRTTSKVGQQYLYNMLRVIHHENNIDDKREKLISKFQVDAPYRLKIQLMLEKINKGNAYYLSSLFQDEHQRPPKWFPLVPILSLASLLTLVMIIFHPRFLLLFLLFFCINMVIHYMNKKNVELYIKSIPQLVRLNGIVAKLHQDPLLKTLNPDLDSSMAVIRGISNKILLFKLEAGLKGEFEVLFWGILELFKAMFLLEPLLLYNILSELDTKREEVEDIFKYAGDVDSLISIASLRAGLPAYCLPDIGHTKFITKDIYHPLIPACITNTLNLDDSSILLTGSNMSGKTSFIRTIGLNVITAYTINTCFASEMNIPKLRIYSAIRISDDLMNNKSYYFEEVLTIKDMLDKSADDHRNLFLLDEIFKGTNTIERIAAGKAVLSSLANNGNIVIVSTHDIELTELLDDTYDLYHFSEIVEEGSVGFDYKLKEGQLKNRNAIRILEINNYPKSLVAEAMEIASRLDNNQ